MDVVKYLVECGANVNSRNNSALEWSAKHGYFEVVKYLVEHGANINIFNIFSDIILSHLRLDIMDYINQQKLKKQHNNT